MVTLLHQTQFERWIGMGRRLLVLLRPTEWVQFALRSLSFPTNCNLQEKVLPPSPLLLEADRVRRASGHVLQLQQQPSRARWSARVWYNNDIFFRFWRCATKLQLQASRSSKTAALEDIWAEKGFLWCAMPSRWISMWGIVNYETVMYRRFSTSRHGTALGGGGIWTDRHGGPDMIWQMH